MIEKLAIVAVGGNSLIQDPAQPDISHQWETVRRTCREIAQMVAEGWHVVITHGNGPQVGFNLRRVEIARNEGLHDLPLDLIVAHTQGSIGYMMQQALNESLRVLGINRTVTTVVTQIQVDANDPAFETPSKPIGAFMSEDDAHTFEAEGWQIMEDAGRGWRRVVASPVPQEIQEINAIQGLMLNGYVVIACGGGGIPVVRDENGSLRGVYAVIDKDRASSLLARTLRADLLLISTGVEKVALNFKTPQQRDLDRMTVGEAQRYMDEGHFARGSMQPKIEAAVDFVQNGGPQAIITGTTQLLAAIRGETGTRIVPGDTHV